MNFVVERGESGISKSKKDSYEIHPRFMCVTHGNSFPFNRTIKSRQRKGRTNSERRFQQIQIHEKGKYGVVKELSRAIVSVPVIKQNKHEYAGLYEAQDFENTLELVINENAIEAVLQKVDNDSLSSPFYQLNNIVINDALFKATMILKDGREELVEGVFINKNDNGIVDFRLGIKLGKSITRNGLHIDKIFFKKM